ncbi:MAG: spore photoproduct lyase family protein [Candidatus Omnitrophota bacterium]
MNEPIDLATIINAAFSLRLNKNQLRDVERLFFEIMRREQTTITEIIKKIADTTGARRAPAGSRFSILKDALISRRFPITHKHHAIAPGEVFLSQVRQPLTHNQPATIPFVPKKIFVERDVRDSDLLKRFRCAFPDTTVQQVARYADYLEQAPFHLSGLKEPLVFIVKEKWDFIKPCPCTKGHRSCGYWIFNIGFGCPFDCSYCFLQQYANFPGVILPANIDNFFEKFNASGLASLKKPIRIGTGEFCDSLALDSITHYSKNLIPFFSTKNVLFELKTKSNAIANLLTMPAPSNIVISWSLNPASIAERDERGAATLAQRLHAAATIQERGWRIGFHFDPIIHSPDWEGLYQETVRLLYAKLKPPFAWISLGTLRCHRELKNRSETRFPESTIFYGELLLGTDKKLRYPHHLRKEIYEKMTTWIRVCDTKSPVYLCMEDNEMWRVLGENFTSNKAVEGYSVGR